MKTEFPFHNYAPSANFFMPMLSISLSLVKNRTVIFALAGFNKDDIRVKRETTFLCAIIHLFGEAGMSRLGASTLENFRTLLC